jgi:hypothetical protein
MPEPSVVFNRLSSLYFKVESSGGDYVSLPIRSPLISCLISYLISCLIQLSLVKSSGLVFLTRKAASLPLSAQKMKKRKIFCTDDSASFVLGERKTKHIRGTRAHGGDCGETVQNFQRAPSDLSSYTSAIVGVSNCGLPIADQVPA